MNQQLTSQIEWSVESIRKLPESMRKANFAYEVIMILIGVTTVVLSTIDGKNGIKIPIIVFELIATFTSLFPVAWSKILDASKKYKDVMMPKSISEPISETLSDTVITQLEQPVAEHESVESADV